MDENLNVSPHGSNTMLGEGLSYGHICTNTNAGKCTFRTYPTLLCSLCRGDGINVIYDKKDEDKIKATIKIFA